MSKSRVSRGGNISNYQPIDSVSTKGLKSIHLDKRVLPLMNDEVTENISIDSKFYDAVPTSGTRNGGVPQPGATCNFNINAASDSLISLSESYFVVNASYTDKVGAGASAQNYSILPFASHLFFDNITTKIGSQDVSDSHADTFYAVSAMHKQFLLKEAEEITVSTPLTRWNLLNKNIAVGAVASASTLPHMSTSGYSSSTTLESLGYSSETVDFQNLVPQAVEANDLITNHNAFYYKALAQEKSVYPVAAGTFTDPFYNTSGNVEFITVPTDGIWRCKNYLPSNTQITVMCKIAPANKFTGCASGLPADYPNVGVSNITLMLCRVKPSQETGNMINLVLLERPFLYNILNSRTEQKSIDATANNSTYTFGSLLNGVIPNVVVVTLVNQQTFDRFSAGTQTNHMLDTHPLSSGLYRKIDPEDNPYTGELNTAGTTAPLIQSIVLYKGSEKIPKNQEYCNYNDQNMTSIFKQQTYDAYVSQCVDSDKPFLSYDHWLNCYTPYVFNLTNSDNGLFVSTDDTSTGSLNIQLSTRGPLEAQYMFVTGLYYSQVSINNARMATKIGF